jgi:hypothetical protein
MTNLKSVTVFLSLLITCHYGKFQAFNLTESQVLEKYSNAKTVNLNEIKKLYLYSKEKNYKQGTLRGLLELQKYYLANGNNYLSLKFGNLAEPIALKLKNNEALSSIYLYKGQVSAILSLYKEAKENLHKSVLYGNKITDKIEKPLQLSAIYANFAGMYEGDKNANDSVSYYLNRSLEVVKSTPADRLTYLQKTNYYDLIITGYMNMGMLYTYILQPARLDKAEPYFEKALEFSNTAPKYFESSDFDAYKAVGIFYSRKKDFRKSIDFFEKALQIEKHKSNPKMRMLVYKELQDSYDSLNNIPKQNQYLNLYSSLNDSINKAEKKSIIEESRDQIRKSAETAKANQNRILKNIIIISVIFILMDTIVIWAFFYRKNKRLKVNYSLLIDKLKNESQKPASITEDTGYDNTQAATNFIDHNSKVTISNNTEKKILKKLEMFEESKKF